MEAWVKGRNHSIITKNDSNHKIRRRLSILALEGSFSGQVDHALSFYARQGEDDIHRSTAEIFQAEQARQSVDRNYELRLEVHGIRSKVFADGVA